MQPNELVAKQTLIKQNLFGLGSFVPPLPPTLKTDLTQTQHEK